MPQFCLLSMQFCNPVDPKWGAMAQWPPPLNTPLSLVVHFTLYNTKDTAVMQCKSFSTKLSFGYFGKHAVDS